MSSRFTPIAELLPSVFQSDEASFEQVSSYLGLADQVQRAYLARLEELNLWLSPNGPVRGWPLDVGTGGGVDAVLDAYEALYDELASWTAFVFPTWWTVIDPDGNRRPDLERRRMYLMRAARLWRRRGTPRGFLDWFCFAFDVDADQRPYLLEHFKYGRPQCPDAPEPGPEPWLRATLLIPSGPRFDAPEMRRITARFVETYAPAHIHMRVCWVDPAFELYQVGSEPDDVRPIPGPRPTNADDPADLEAQLTQWAVEVEAFREHLRCLLCSLVGDTSDGAAIHVAACIDEGEAKDRLGLGRLPGGGTFVADDPN